MRLQHASGGSAGCLENVIHPHITVLQKGDAAVFKNADAVADPVDELFDCTPVAGLVEGVVHLKENRGPVPRNTRTNLTHILFL